MKIETLRRRLAAWEREKITNEFGFADIADMAIAEIRKLIAEYTGGAKK